MLFSNDHIYKNREEAGNILALSLKRYTGLHGVILAIPRGGVPVGFIIAAALGFKLDLALSKKIGHPLHKEYAIGAVSITDSFVEDHEEVSEAYIEQEKQAIRQRLQEMYATYMGKNQQPEVLTGKTVIITDDGLATGRTMLSTISMARTHHPEALIVAVPVASRSGIQAVSRLADGVICPLVPDTFKSVGNFYEDFEQVSDEDVIDYIQRNKLTV